MSYSLRANAAAIVLPLTAMACNPQFDRASDMKLEIGTDMDSPITPNCNAPQVIPLINCMPAERRTPGTTLALTLEQVPSSTVPPLFELSGNCTQALDNYGFQGNTHVSLSGFTGEVTCTVGALTPPSAEYSTVKIAIDDTVRFPAINNADVANPSTVTAFGKVSFGAPISQAFGIIDDRDFDTTTEGFNYTLNRSIGDLSKAKVTFGLFVSCANRWTGASAPSLPNFPDKKGVTWVIRSLTARSCKP